MARSTSALALPTAAARRSSPRPRWHGVLAACWGTAGQVALVAVPAALLLRAALQGLSASDLGPSQWALAAASVLLLGGYVQGYRGFQRGYAPFVAARAAHLAANPRPLHVLLAPLHVCGLLHATRRRRAKTALLFAIMPLLAAGVGRVPDPYRSIVDLGVVVGLTWGASAILLLSVRAALGRVPAVPLDLPPASR